MTFFVSSNGCVRRSFEAEHIKKWLALNAQTLTDCINLADIIIFISCAFDEPHERGSRAFLASAPKQKTILFGCFPSIVSNFDFSQFKAIISLEEMFDWLDESFAFSVKIKSLNLEKSIIISRGCLSNCSYCGIKKSTKSFYSLPIETIVSHINSSKEDYISLLAEDTGAWGLDLGSTLPDLIKNLSKLPKKYYLDNMNVDWFLAYYNELLPYFGEKICHITIAFQHIDSSLLQKMGRNIFDPNELFEKVKNAIEITGRKISFTFYVLFAFPSETEDQFQALYDYCRKLKTLSGIRLSSFCFHRKENSKIEEGDLPILVKEERKKKMINLGQQNERSILRNIKHA